MKNARRLPLIVGLLPRALAWAGLVIAYYVPYPVGFFITTIAFGSYLVARVGNALAGRGAALRPRPDREEQFRHSP